MNDQVDGPNAGNSGQGSGNGGNPGQDGGDPGHGGGNPGHGGGKDQAHIMVDNVPKTVREGDWLVSDLKLAMDVDVAKVLAEIMPSGLRDLDDGARIAVRDGMRFMSHARTGGSS
ncbi:MAG: hypothetical protein E5Y89_02430 [Mesorhizobium sp.]|nr:MAG: hypothetical protein E5Y89_02430 [Mesorhizobium sp.]